MLEQTPSKDFADCLDFKKIGIIEHMDEQNDPIETSSGDNSDNEMNIDLSDENSVELCEESTNDEQPIRESGDANRLENLIVLDKLNVKNDLTK